MQVLEDTSHQTRAKIDAGYAICSWELYKLYRTSGVARTKEQIPEKDSAISPTHKRIKYSIQKRETLTNRNLMVSKR